MQLAAAMQLCSRRRRDAGAPLRLVPETVHDVHLLIALARQVVPTGAQGVRREARDEPFRSAEAVSSRPDKKRRKLRFLHHPSIAKGILDGVKAASCSRIVNGNLDLRGLLGELELLPRATSIQPDATSLRRAHPAAGGVVLPVAARKRGMLSTTRCIARGVALWTRPRAVWWLHCLVEAEGPVILPHDFDPDVIRLHVAAMPPCRCC